MKPDDVLETRVDALRLVHTAAHEMLDEHPDPRVRATVLAAAARAVQAGPHRPVRNAYAQRRWPWSLAAVLLVSVATGLIATQALRDDPARVLTARVDGPSATVATTSRAAIAAAPNAPPVPAASTAAVIESRAKTATPRPPSPAAASTPAMLAHASRRVPVEATTAAAGRPAASSDEAKAAIVDRGDEPAHRAATPTARQEPVPFPTAVARVADAPSFAPGVPPAAPPPLAAPVASGAANADSIGTRAMRSNLVAPIARLAADPANAAPHGRVGIEPVSPEAWVARIVALRADGNDEAADREVEALHRRYPDFAIPQNALRITREPRAVSEP